MKDYISGFFDADGSITLSKSSSKSIYKTIKMDFTNTDLHILEDIKEFLLKEGISSFISTKKVYKKHHAQSYVLSINSNQMCLKLCAILNSRHKKKRHRISTVLKYHNMVTKRNGKYSQIEHNRKIAYERLFYFLK